MKTFIHGGFECSSHIQNGQRLDLIETTGHIRWVRNDYKALSDIGVKVVREGLLWNKVDNKGRYDFSNYLPIVKAANEFGMEVIWDFCHYGFPDDLTTDSEDFIERFENFAIEAYLFLKENLDSDIHICLMNEPSFLSKNLEENSEFDSSRLGCSKSLGNIKRIICKAIIDTSKILKSMGPITLYHIDPLIHIAYKDEELREEVRWMRETQFESLDIVLGRIEKELGGEESLVDIIGVNHYPYSNWWHGGEMISQNNPFYHSLSKQLSYVRSRYSQPIYISETGMEGPERSDWVDYVVNEVRNFDDVIGVCIYPITDYPGWADNRYCDCGLLSYPNEDGIREIYEPLKNSIQKALTQVDRGAIISL